MIASFLRNYLRLKVITMVTKLIFNKKKNAPSGKNKMMFLSFIIEELVNQLFSSKKTSKKSYYDAYKTSNKAQSGKVYDAEK